MYRAYIKDQLNINTLPKAFLEVRAFTVRRDLLTSVNSTFTCVEVFSNINEGDILCLYKPTGEVIYYGVITQISDAEITCNQIQSIFNGLWVYDTYPSSFIEDEVAYLLEQYAHGFQKDSTYQDMLIYDELAPLDILSVGATSGQLETMDEQTTMNFEEFMYSLYQKYGIVFDFTIPYGAWNIGDQDGSVTVRQPSSSVIVIGNNTDVIKNISPTTEVEQTNKLIVYAQDGTYRTTYVYTTTNGIVTEPTTIAGRLGKVNTSVVYSDDPLDDIKEANISSEMFNHQISFDMYLDNKLYDFFSWELGQPMSIWNNGVFFDSVFTGYEMALQENQELTEVKVICGKVRTKLTSLLKMGVAR